MPEYDPGSYRLTVLSADPITLARTIRYQRTTQLELAGVTEPFGPGQQLLLGGPGTESFEIVEIEQVDLTPGQAPSYTVRRNALRTLGGPHRSGTPVLPITAERIPAVPESDS